MGWPGLEVLRKARKHRRDLMSVLGPPYRTTELRRLGRMGRLCWSPIQWRIAGTGINSYLVTDSEVEYRELAGHARELHSHGRELTTQARELDHHRRELELQVRELASEGREFSVQPRELDSHGRGLPTQARESEN